MVSSRWVRPPSDATVPRPDDRSWRRAGRIGRTRSWVRRIGRTRSWAGVDRARRTRESRGFIERHHRRDWWRESSADQAVRAPRKPAGAIRVIPVAAVITAGLLSCLWRDDHRSGSRERAATSAPGCRPHPLRHRYSTLAQRCSPRGGLPPPRGGLGAARILYGARRAQTSARIHRSGGSAPARLAP